MGVYKKTPKKFKPPVPHPILSCPNGFYQVINSQFGKLKLRNAMLKIEHSAIETIRTPMKNGRVFEYAVATLNEAPDLELEFSGDENKVDRAVFDNLIGKPYIPFEFNRVGPEYFTQIKGLGFVKESSYQPDQQDGEFFVYKLKIVVQQLES